MIARIRISATTAEDGRQVAAKVGWALAFPMFLTTLDGGTPIKQNKEHASLLCVCVCLDVLWNVCAERYPAVSDRR